MPQAISKNDIKRYERLIEERGVCGVKAVYLDLQRKGYTYAGWAYGVASGSTITGQAALDFMQQVAREKKHKEIPPSKIREIRIRMALGYLTALSQNIKKDGGHSTTRDADSEQIRGFHDQGFHKSGYDLDYWTLKIPMDLVYRYSGGTEGQERVWRALSKTEGGGFDAIASSMGLSSYVKLFSDNNVLFRNIHTGEYVSPSTYRISVDNLISRPEDYERQTIDSNDNLLAKNWASKIGYAKPLVDWHQFHYDELRRLTDLNYSNKENCEPLDPKSNNDWFGLQREKFFFQTDPLTLDLNGNGIETLAANGHDGAMFDHERLGIRTATGWVHSNDGILVYDRNGDGKINDGGEFFGDNTLLKNGKTAAHGFEAAAELDENGDGKLDAADSAFGKLGIWRDLNHNGISEAGEIFALKDLRIQSLNLGYTQADKDLGNGNTLAEVGSYTDEDGNEHIMGDLHLAADRLHSRYSESIPLTDEQQQEVNLRGSGRLRDLREAAAQSSELAEVLQQYKNAATKEEQLALRDKLLQAWANTDPRRIEDFKSAISTLNTITQGGGRKGVGLTPSQIKHMGEIAVMGFWKTLGEPDPAGQKQAELNRKIAILDAFTGTRSPHLYYFSKKEAQHIVDTVNDTYERLADSLYDGLLFQTRLRPYLDAIRLSVNEEGEYRIDYSGVSTLFTEIHKTDPGKAFTDLGELLAKGNADGKNTAMAPLAEQFVQYAAEAGQNGTFAQYAAVLGKKNLETLGHRLGSDGNDNLSGNESANYLAGENGNDTLNGYGGNDVLSGGNGNDKLYGGKGHDILSGDAGNDHMQGGDYESDTYLFAKGHGKDSIYDWARNDDEADKIVFNGAKARDAVFGREGADLTIRAYGNEQDQVNIQGFFSAPASNQHHFQFDDATLKVSDIAQKAFAFDRTSGNGWITDDTIHGTAGNDDISGADGNDILNGNDGNDTLRGDNGDDTLNGDNGNDKLYGGKGHDILSGDAGNDHMQGGDYESDTYLFAKGHGKDSIYDWARNDDEADKIVFNGAKARDAVFGREGADLTIRAYGNEQDQVNIQGFFSAPASNQHHFQFDDATLKVSDIAQKAFAFDRTSGNGWITDDTIHGTAGNDDISGADGNDTLNGNDGDDTLSGDNGDDTLNGGNGNDKLYGGKGHDILNGDAGNDHMQGGDYESDIYLFAKGHGKDSIYDWARNDNEADKIVFNGAKARDAVFGREGADLTIRAYGNEQDQVTIQSYYSHPGQNYYDLQFDDATYDAAALRSRDLLKDGLPSVPVAEEKTAAQMADDVKAEAAPASSAGTIQTAENVAAQAAADTAASAQTVKEAKAETASATAAGTKAVTDSSATAAAPVRVLTTQAASADSPQGATGTADGTATPAAGGAQSTTAASDARAAAQAQHLIEAMAAFDTRSAAADNLAAPPLQQPPLAAADTATVKPLLP